MAAPIFWHHTSELQVAAVRFSLGPERVHYGSYFLSSAQNRALVIAEPTPKIDAEMVTHPIKYIAGDAEAARASVNRPCVARSESANEEPSPAPERKCQVSCRTEGFQLVARILRGSDHALAASSAALALPC